MERAAIVAQHVVSAGDRVPADADVIEQTTFSADESALTGESMPVAKDGAASILFMGTNIVEGRGMGQVTVIGTQTRFGQIAALTSSGAHRPTYLQNQLRRLAAQLGPTALTVAALILVVGVLSGRSVSQIFMTATSLAVAMVPEGLPAVVTVTIALGAASVICTDNTGTLTENKMTATQIWTPQGSYLVTGAGYDPSGYIARNGDKRRAPNDPQLAALLEGCAGCNYASLQHNLQGWSMIGSPTEGALSPCCRTKGRSWQ